jgi:threonine synthase
MQKILEKFTFQCVTCGTEYAEKEVMYLCPDCALENTADLPPKGILKVVYDYFLVQDLLPDKNVSFFNYLKSIRFASLLPINNIFSLPRLRIGDTPLYRQKRLFGNKLKFNLYLKDDSQNPTYSFKDRASAIVSAYAKEHDFDTIVTASTGNAGSSLAGICASQKQKAVIMVPETAPKAKLTQIMMYGAEIIPVKGNYDQAFDLSIQATEQYGWYNRNTAYNPLTVEGKKIVSFELFDQLDLHIPDRVFVSVGDGVILSGVYKGFEDLMQLGIIEEMPKIIAVQSEGSDNLIRNLDSEKFVSKQSKTIADSISVDIPRNFYMAKDYMQRYSGEFISVSDDEILQASNILAKETGLFAEPAAAAAYAGMLAYMEIDAFEKDSINVILLTGSGLKDIESILPYISKAKPSELNI